jgi:AcrR family transcriptional regulator
MQTPPELTERIADEALLLILEQGIRGTTVEEVARQAGVSRMTVYRHFPDKPAVVRAAFLRVAGLFQSARADIQREAAAGVEPALDRVFRYFSIMPRGPVLVRLDELKQLYPEVYREYREMRSEALNGIFDALRDAITARGLLRPGLREEVVRAMFLEAAVNILDSPAVKELDAPPEEIYATIRTVLLHGVLVTEPAAEYRPVALPR